MAPLAMAAHGTTQFGLTELSEVRTKNIESNPMMVSRPLGSNPTLPVALQSVVTSKGEPKEIERSNTISLGQHSVVHQEDILWTIFRIETC
jgi:hypothetical protein